MVIIYLVFSLPKKSSNLPERSVGFPTLLFGLAPDRVFQALNVTIQAVSPYLTFSPLPNSINIRRFFSVALSVKFPCPAVNRYPNPKVLGLSSSMQVIEAITRSPFDFTYYHINKSKKYF